MRDPNAQTPTPQAWPQPSSFGSPLDTLLRHQMIEQSSGPGLLGALDHYQIRQLLGSGGMGIVLLAQDTHQDTEVALKLPRPELMAHSPALQRFLGEARHMQKLVHPHILKVLEIHEDPRRPYFVMPYCRRGSLAQLIKDQTPLESGLVFKLARQIAEALAFAHRKGIIHCDLKPGNVLLDEAGDACLTDFGLARLVMNDAWALTESSEGVGTAPYMSPALAAGEVEDTRCDIYSFGALLYEMLTGLPPYTGQNAPEIRAQIRAGPPRPLREVQPQAPSGLAMIAEKAMSRELRDRYANMSDVLSDLDRMAKVEQFQRQHHTELVTLLFTDIVGSMDLKHELGDRLAAELLLQHDALVRELLPQFPEGEEIQTAGDSFLLVFTKPSEAVRFSLLLQARLRQWNRQARAPVRDRVGIHLGEVLRREPGTATQLHGFIGLAVDACARVMSLAKGGQILMTRAVFDSARQVLKGDDLEGASQLAWLSHGPYLLKGVDEPVEICEVGEVGHSPLSAPPTSEKAQRHVSADSEPVLGWRPAVGQAVPNTKWILEQKLGEGGVGEVWLGRHTALKEQRVFKFCFQANRVRSLKREVTLFRLLKERIGNHPNIVGVQEVFFDEAPYYLMMDYSAGKDLRDWCDAQGGINTVPLEARLEIVAQIADALQAAHDAGVIHRDVKPANILVSGQGSVASNQKEPVDSSLVPRPSSLVAKLTDFGIGQVLSQEYLEGITRAGFTETMLADSSSSKTGTQLYMAPELLAGQPASIRSDIYSLGVVLFQLLVGDFSRPLTTDWAKHLEDPLLREDLEHCFAGNPQERFAGAAQLARNLRGLPKRQAELAERQQAERNAQSRRRIWVALASSTAVFLLVALGLGYGLHQAQRQRDRAEALLYASDMNQAFEVLKDNNLERLGELLDRHRPLRGQHDLRGWEWCYLWQEGRSSERQTMGEHPVDVLVLAFSPNGRMLASADWDGRIKVWDVETCRLITNYLHIASGHTNRVVTALAFSNDSTHIYAGAFSWGGEELLMVMDTTNWKAVTPFKTPLLLKPSRPMALSPGGNFLAIASESEVILSDLVLQQVVSRITGQYGKGVELWTACAAFSTDAHLFAYHESGTVHVWDVTLKKQVASFKGSSSRCFTLSISPDGRQVAAGYDDHDSVQVWDLVAQTPAVSLMNNVPGVYAVLFSPDGNTLAVAGVDGQIILWDREMWTEISRLRGHKKGIYHLAYSPDGTLLASASLDNTVKLWDAHPVNRKSALVKFPADLYPGPWRSVYLGKQSPFLVFPRSNQTFMVWEKKSLKQTLEGPLPISNFLRSAISPDGQMIAFGGSDGKISLFEIATMKDIGGFQLDKGEAWILQFSGDGKLLAAAPNPGKPQLRVWEVKSRQKVAEFAIGANALTFSADARYVATVSYYPGTAHLWDLESGRLIASLPAAERNLTDIAISPDNRYVATSGQDGTKLWELANGKLVASLRHKSLYTYSVTFSPDSRRVASAGGEFVTLWDVATCQELGSLRSTHGTINWLEFLPDGKTLLVAGDRGIFSWQAPTLEEISNREKSAR